MKKVTVTDGQTLINIAVQAYGCYEGITLLLEDNYPISITEDLSPGQELNVREEVPYFNETNQSDAAYFEINDIKVNRGWNKETTGQFRPDQFTEGFVIN